MNTLSLIDSEGEKFAVCGIRAVGICNSSGSSANKSVNITNNCEMVPGMLVSVKFSEANTYGSTKTQYLYSSDGTNFYSDTALTNKVTLAPATNRYLKYTGTGNVYEYYYYPTVSIGAYNNVPLCDSRGHYAGGMLWTAGEKITLFYDGEVMMIQNSAVSVLDETDSSAINAKAVTSTLNEFKVDLGSKTIVQLGNYVTDKVPLNGQKYSGAGIFNNTTDNNGQCSFIAQAEKTSSGMYIANIIVFGNGAEYANQYRLSNTDKSKWVSTKIITSSVLDAAVDKVTDFYNHYQQGFTGVYKITVPYTSTNSTSMGSITITGRAGNRWTVNFYAIIDGSGSDSYAVKVFQEAGNAYTDVFGDTVKWAVDTENALLNIYLKKNATNQRSVFAVNCAYANSISITALATTDEWDSASYSGKFSVFTTSENIMNALGTAYTKISSVNLVGTFAGDKVVSGSTTTYYCAIALPQGKAYSSVQLVSAKKFATGETVDVSAFTGAISSNNLAIKTTNATYASGTYVFEVNLS